MSLEELIREYFESKERLKDVQATVKANKYQLIEVCIEAKRFDLFKLDEGALNTFYRKLQQAMQV